MSSYLLPNIANAERAVRALLGLAALSLAVVGPQSRWGLLGLIPLATALVGFCPLYAVLGISTRTRRTS